MWRVLNNCPLDCIKTQQLLVLLHVTWGPRNQLGWEVRGSDPPSPGTHLPAEDPAPPWGVLEARPPHRTGPHDPVRGPLVHPPCHPHIRRKQQPGVEDAASRTTQAATKSSPLSSPEARPDLELLEEEGSYQVPRTHRRPGARLSALKHVPARIPTDAL